MRELNHLYSLAIVLHQSCILYQLRGDRQAVDDSSTELITLSAQQGFAHWLATGTIFQGWCKAVSGELETGIAEMRRGLAAKQGTGAQLKVPYYLGLMAGVRGQADRDGAITLLVEALARVEKTGERWFEAELHRLWGEQLLRAPNNGSTVECRGALSTRVGSSPGAASKVLGTARCYEPRPPLGRSKQTRMAGSPRASTRRT
jgi:predicted ATPase